jgi:hypothetical protein
MTKTKTVSPGTNQKETAPKSQLNNTLSPISKQEQLSISQQVKALFKSGDNSSASQRQRILRYLQQTGPITTLQCRFLLDVMHPGARLQELRKAGYLIDMVMVDDATPEGNQHEVGQHTLVKSPQLSLFNTVPHRQIAKDVSL